MVWASIFGHQTFGQHSFVWATCLGFLGELSGYKDGWLWSGSKVDAFTLGSTTKNISYYLRIVVIFQTVGLHIILSSCKNSRQNSLLPRDAIHPWYWPWPSVRPSVSLSVRLSVTSWCSTKTAKRRITQTTPHDSSGTLVFWCQRSPRNSTGVTPYGGAKCRWVGQNRRLSTNNWLYLENGTR